MAKPDWNREGRDWPHREASRFVEAGGLRWHVQVMGSGPVVLLLHGTGSATHSWRGLMPLLAEQFTVVAPDLPGHGFTSTPRDEAMSLPGMAEGIAALLEALALAPALTVGNSAGAAIAVRMVIDGALHGPIVAINGALMPFAGPAAVLFPTLAKLLFVNPFVPRIFALQGQSHTMVKSFLERSTGSVIDGEGIRFYKRLLASSGHCAAPLTMMANWDLDSLKRDYGRFTSPLLLLHAEHDAAIPPSDGAKIKALIPQSEVRMLNGLGHLAHEEDPALLAKIIIEWAGERT